MKNHNKTIKQKDEGISRRDFMGRAAAVAAFTIVPRHVLGGTGQTPPSEKLNIAAIGAGGMGKANIDAVKTENIVALCDVDDEHAAETYRLYPDAKKYKDFRRMLEKEKNIEAVIIATPDHTHAVAAMAAIQAGKHVYVQKPLTRTIYEVRKLTEAARNAGAITQMGTQGHSGEGIRLICEWIWDGAIGPVREVHAWTNRPIWPQGIARPKEEPPVPDTLDWDLWLGPAPHRPYHPAYAPFKWRGWWDFGCGALGDMGCHIIDPAFWALKLSHPTSVEATSTNDNPVLVTDEVRAETAPAASIVTYNFSARGDMPPVTLTWYDGGIMPPRPQELEDGRRMGEEGGGLIFVGDKGKLMSGGSGRNPRLIPETAMKAYNRPAKTLPRVPRGADGHEQDWVSACKQGRQPSSNFEYSGPFTEVVLLGNLAIRTGEKLYWDGPNMKVTNVPEANEFVHHQYRNGWTL